VNDADTDQRVTMARMTGAELLRQMRELIGTLAATADRLTGAVATVADPTAAEAERRAAMAGIPSGVGRIRDAPGESFSRLDMQPSGCLKLKAAERLPLEMARWMTCSRRWLIPAAACCWTA
jgi:hypothetical protein